MFINKKHLYIVFILFFWQSYFVIAQNQTSLEKHAEQAFSKSQYTVALVDYRQLLAKDQQNPLYNYRYGVCLYEAVDHLEAAKYFDVVLGLNQSADPLIFYYRGLIYQEQYFFTPAIRLFEMYRDASQEIKNPKDVQKLIAQCQRAKDEIEAYVQLPLLSIDAITNQKFYNAYPFNSDDYTFYEAPELHTKNNAKHNFVPVYAYKRGMKYRILASYGPKGDQLDLYLQLKDAENNWGELIFISGGINTPFSDETFGFIDPQTGSLYFSSTANSIGGHDIFKADFNLGNGSASNIQRLPYPYSSPVNDLFYVIDRKQEKAYFATNRQGLVGQYEIYTLAVEQEISPSFVFYGHFSDELQPGSSALSLQFIDIKSNQVFGPFLTDENGDYQVVLLGAGPYKMEIDVDGASRSYFTRFEMPTLKNGSMLYQQIRYFNDELGKEQWQVLNQIRPNDDILALSSLSKIQLNAAQGLLLQPQRKSVDNTILDQFTLEQQWGINAKDTAAFVSKLVDTLIAAEVSLENQASLLAILRNDFEQKLNEREKLLVELSTLIQTNAPRDDLQETKNELEAVESALSLAKLWIEINQNANIPDLVLLKNIKELNEQNQFKLLKNDTLSLIDNWNEQQSKIQQYLQIAAFDATQALEAQKTSQQYELQKTLRDQAANKEQLQRLNEQVNQLNSNFELQSKREQTQRKSAIENLENQRILLIDIEQQLSAQREMQEQILQIIEQDERIDEYLTKAENEKTPNLDGHASFQELVAEYAQQDIIYNQINNQLAQLDAIAKTEEGNEKKNENNSREEESVARQNNAEIEQAPTEILANEERAGEQIIEQIDPNALTTQAEQQNENNSREQESIAAQNTAEIEQAPTEIQANEERAGEQIIEQTDPNALTTQAEQKNENNSLEQESVAAQNTAEIEQAPTEILANEERAGEQIIEQIDPIALTTQAEQKNENNSREEESVATHNTAEIEQAPTEILASEERAGEQIIEQTDPNALTTQAEQQNENNGLEQESIAGHNASLIEIENTENTEVLTEIQALNSLSQVNSKAKVAEKVDAFFVELAKINAQTADVFILDSEFKGLALTPKELNALEDGVTFSLANESVEDFKINMLQQEDLIRSYLDYIQLRWSFEQLKIELQQNQQMIADNQFDTTKKEELLILMNQQEELLEKLENQHEVITQYPNQKTLEALIQEEYVIDLSKINVEQAQSNKSAPSVFKIEKQIDISQPLPINVPCPDGLVFRVQIGAFRKPVASDRFRDFTPVDGRVLQNGLTVYMAGYFRSSKEALAQQKNIRALGYNDAFVVAYNNCDRLTLGQGRLLEQNDLAKETSTNTNQKIFAEPGVGLFYSVQIGVYNKPLTSTAPFGLPDLIEARNNKGQYRYASGKFEDLNAAKKRQQEAVAKGIKDAFIVAYFEGQRIDLAKAKALKESGILIDTKVELTQIVTIPNELGKEIQTMQIPKKQTIIPPDPVIRYELKCDDCQSQLTRLNRVGVFVYNEDKSIVYSPTQKQSDFTSMQQLYLKDLRKRNATFKSKTSSKIFEEIINGGFADWLLRQQNHYQFSVGQGALEIHYLED